MVEPVEGGRAFYARCMVCGKVGPTRRSSEDAYHALTSGAEEGRSEDEGNSG